MECRGTRSVVLFALMKEIQCFYLHPRICIVEAGIWRFGVFQRVFFEKKLIKSWKFLKGFGKFPIILHTQKIKFAENSKNDVCLGEIASAPGVLNRDYKNVDLRKK